MSPFKTIDEHAAKLRGRIGLGPIPSTFILLIDNMVAGSVSLLDHDDVGGVRPDLAPWLASLLVERRYRGRGYGRALARHCIEQARILGLSALYLYTDAYSEFYTQLGWQPIEERISRGLAVTVMKLGLDPL